MDVFSKKGIAVNELMGWILIVLVVFVILIIVTAISGKFDIKLLDSWR